MTLARPGGTPAARLAGVGLRYGKTVALDAIDLVIPAGCMVGLIGPDGAGKSSLLALISGARRVQQGNVEVLGGNMRSRRHRGQVCPAIAYMPQGLGKNLYPARRSRTTCSFSAACSATMRLNAVGASMS